MGKGEYLYEKTDQNTDESITAKGTVRLKHENGITKKAKIGFSWTMLFFGMFVPLFRGDLKWALLSFLLAILTAGISWLVLPFKYNTKYIEKLLEKGYKPADRESRKRLQQAGIIS